MKDIKKLFENAKYHSNHETIKEYTEALDELFQTNPRAYLSNTEYIISSSYGAKQFHSFVEKYGLPIPAFHDVMTILENVIDRGEKMGKQLKDQENLRSYLESYQTKYPSLFMMYESMSNNDPTMGLNSVLVESSSEQNKAAKKIANNIIGVIKDMRKKIKKITFQKTDESNEGLGFFDKDKIGKPLTKVLPGDKNDPYTFGNASLKNKIKKGLQNDLKSSDEYLSDVRLHVVFELQLPSKPENGMVKKFQQVVFSSINEALKDLMSNGTLKFDNPNESYVYKSGKNSVLGHKSEEMKEYFYVTYYLSYSFPFKINKKVAFKGINTDAIREFSNEEFIDMVTDAIADGTIEVVESTMDEYLSNYYSLTENTQGRTIISKMLSSHGDIAIPDILMTAHSMNENAVSSVYYLLKEYIEDSPILNQYLLESVMDLKPSDRRIIPIIESIEKDSLSYIVSQCKNRNLNAYRESMISGDIDPQAVYYPEEIDAIKALISFNEYKMLYTEDEEKRSNLTREIISLYEEVEGLEIPFTESDRISKSSAIRKITNNLKVLAKDVLKTAKVGFKEDSNYNSCVIATGFGDKEAPFINKQINSGRVKKEIEDIADLTDEYINNLVLWVIIASSKPINDPHKVVKATKKILKPFIKDKKISYIDTDITFPYTKNPKKIMIPFNISKDTAVSDVDVDIFESMKFLGEDIITEMTDMLTGIIAPINEDTWWANGLNQKNGRPPAYLLNNHNIGKYEDDEGEKKNEEDNTDPMMDDFLRPSANDTIESDEDSEDYDGVSGGKTLRRSSDDESGSPGTTNYYYYTYNNSLNKNHDSYNSTNNSTNHTTDNSTRSDNHSTYSSHSSTDSHDVHSSDNHSSVDINDSSRHSTKSNVRNKDDHSKKYKGSTVNDTYSTRDDHSTVTTGSNNSKTDTNIHTTDNHSSDSHNKDNHATTNIDSSKTTDDHSTISKDSHNSDSHNVDTDTHDTTHDDHSYHADDHSTTTTNTDDHSTDQSRSRDDHRVSSRSTSKDDHRVSTKDNHTIKNKQKDDHSMRGSNSTYADFSDFEDMPMKESSDDDDEESHTEKKDLNPDTPTSDKDEEFVPIFGVVKQYTDDDKRNDGIEKSDHEKTEVSNAHLIKWISRGDNYSHTVVSFNDDLTEMYSYEPAGFVQDSIKESSWMCTKSIYICVMFVKKSDKERMKKFVNDLVDHKNETKYSYPNLIRAYVSKPVKADKRYICSSFTSYILQCSNPKNLHRDYSRQRPEDITILPRAFYVMNVKDAKEFEDKKSEFKQKIKDIYDKHIDEVKDYNNHLPKLMLMDRVDELKTLDKILEWILKQ